MSCWMEAVPRSAFETDRDGEALSAHRRSPSRAPLRARICRLTEAYLYEGAVDAELFREERQKLKGAIAAAEEQLRERVPYDAPASNPAPARDRRPGLAGHLRLRRKRRGRARDPRLTPRSIPSSSASAPRPGSIPGPLPAVLTPCSNIMAHMERRTLTIPYSDDLLLSLMVAMTEAAPPYNPRVSPPIRDCDHNTEAQNG